MDNQKYKGKFIPPQQKEFEKWYTIGQGGCGYFTPDIIDNGIRTKSNKYVSDLITENAIGNIEEFSKHRDKSFYLSVQYTAPHSPWGLRLHPLITKSAPIVPGILMKNEKPEYFYGCTRADVLGSGKSQCYVFKIKEKK